MRITYFTNNYPAVSHTFIRRELQGLEQRGHKIQRVSLRSPRILVDQLDIDEQTLTTNLLEQSPFTILKLVICRFLRHPLRSLKAIKLAVSLWRAGNRPIKLIGYFLEAMMLAELCRSHKSQLLRVHFGTNGALVARLCRRMGGPQYSIAYHGPDEFDNPFKWDIGGVIAESAFVTAITSFCSAQLMRWAEPDQWDKIHIVRCAVGDSFLQPAPLPTSPRRDLCIVARLSAQKGLPLLLDGFARAVKNGADLGLQIVGDGEMREEIESRIRLLKLDDRIQLHGSLPGSEVKSVIEQCSGIVLPSFAEGLPVVLMEAMGLGRPAITTAIAGIPELVVHGKNGWLIPSGSVPRLVEALTEFARLPLQELVAMGLHGHEAVKQCHRIENEVKALDSIICKLLDGN